MAAGVSAKILSSNDQQFCLRNGVDINSRLIKDAIKQARVMARQILKQNLPHITLAVAMAEEKNHIGVLYGMDQKLQIVKVGWSSLT